MAEGKRKYIEKMRKKRAAYIDQQIEKDLKEVKRLNKILRFWGRK